MHRRKDRIPNYSTGWWDFRGRFVKLVYGNDQAQDAQQFLGSESILCKCLVLSWLLWLIENGLPSLGVWHCIALDTLGHGGFSLASVFHCTLVWQVIW